MKKNRPISPHLTIYRPQLTSMLSIFHRVSGGILALSLFFGFFFVNLCSMYSSNYFFYSLLQLFLNNSVIWFLIFTFGIFLVLLFHYHISNGIRHLFWDLGYGFDLKYVYLTGSLVLVSAVVFTLVFIYFIF